MRYWVSWSNVPRVFGVETCRLLDGGPNARISRASADVAAHGGIDVRVSGLGLLVQQRRRRHDLAGLTVPALHDIQSEPCLLNLLARLRVADALDRGDRTLTDCPDGRNAGTRGIAVYVHCAATAQAQT